MNEQIAKILDSIKTSSPIVHAITKRHLKGASILSNCQCKNADD